MNIAEQFEICETLKEAITYYVSQSEKDDNFYHTLLELTQKWGNYICEQPPIVSNDVKSLLNLYTWVIQTKQKVQSIYILPSYELDTNIIDKKFHELIKNIENASHEQVYNTMINYFMKLSKEHRNSISSYAKTYKFLGDIDPNTGKGSMVEERVNILKNHLTDLSWLYNRLCDYRSRAVLYSLLFYWLSYDFGALQKIKEPLFSDYFDLDMIVFDKNDVIVDVGAFIGDSALQFISTYGACKKIYCYEIDPKNAEIAKTNTKQFPFIEIRQKAAGDKNGELFLDLNNAVSSNSKVSSVGSVSVPCVKIDDDIQEKVDFIKMDIEGAEQSALKGCVRHIQQYRAKLAICTYHGNYDLWQIPRLIDTMRNDYQFYMRYNGGNLFPTEFVLFAL